jgi:hypothetical protein
LVLAPLLWSEAIGRMKAEGSISDRSRQARLDAARRLRTSEAPLLLFLLAALIGGCGAGAQNNTAGTVDAHPKTAPSGAKRSASARGGDGAVREGRAGERQLASHACEALSPAMAASLDPRLRKQPAGGGSLDICSYSAAPEQPPPLHLILELIPSPAEPSESVAKAICQKLIKQVINGYRHTTSAAPAPLGEEAVVASTFKRDETGLVGDETTYVADWREGGSCASLIFGSQKPARPPPLSKFTDLAVLVSGSGRATSEGAR